MNFNSALGSDFLEAGAQWLCLCLLLLFQFLLVINVSCLITNTISQREELQGGVKTFHHGKPWYADYTWETKTKN